MFRPHEFFHRRQRAPEYQFRFTRAAQPREHDRQVIQNRRQLEDLRTIPFSTIPSARRWRASPSVSRP